MDTDQKFGQAMAAAYGLTKSERDDLEALRRHQRQERRRPSSGGPAPRSELESMLLRALHNRSPDAQSTTSSAQSELSAASCGGIAVQGVKMEPPATAMEAAQQHQAGGGGVVGNARRKRTSNEVDSA